MLQAPLSYGICSRFARRRLPACSDSEDAGIRFTDTITYGKQAIQRHMIEAPDSPAVSVALLWKEQIVWQEAFGLASVTDKEPATVHTRFNIGSVSKVFAGLTGVILRDQGVLDLDAPVATPGHTLAAGERPTGIRRISAWA